jgi:hypothetical protein
MVLTASPDVMVPQEGPPLPPAPAPRDELLRTLAAEPSPGAGIDPGLAGGLRAWLEDAASAVVRVRGEHGPPLFLGTRLLLGAPIGGATGKAGAGAAAAGTAADPDLILACLVRTLFRQIVTTRSIGDPLNDALAALAVDPWRHELVDRVMRLPERERAALRRSLAAHAEHLVDLTPQLPARWLPRTHDRVAIPLAGGRVVLHGTIEMLLGPDQPGGAPLAALAVTTGGPWAPSRAALRYLALLETLRGGTPPRRLALLHSALGRSRVEEVTEEHLGEVAALVAQRLPQLARADAVGSTGARGRG